MKINAPVNSVKAAEMLAKIGVDEVYVGVDSPPHQGMKFMTFNGRNTYEGDLRVQLESFKELKEVVDIFHQINAKVNFTANTKFLPEELNNYFSEYIECAVEQGVDSLIIGSLGGLVLASEKKYNVELHSSTLVYPHNKYCLDFLNKLNVKRVILPVAMSIEEISQIRGYIEEKNYDIGLEAFCQYGCSNINGRCNICQTPISEEEFTSVTCKGNYDVYDINGNNIRTGYQFLSAGTYCSVCSLKDLKECKVDCLKILGRCQPIEGTIPVLIAYKNAIRMVEEGCSIDEVKEELFRQAPWWPHAFCKNKKCMYMDFLTNPFYI